MADISGLARRGEVDMGCDGYVRETGYGPMDEQHARLAEGVRGVAEALEAGSEREVASRLRGLTDGLLAHFASEEASMAASGFPRAARHTLAHRNFLEDLLRWRDRLSTGGLSDDFVRWATGPLPEWLHLHLSAFDQDLAEFLLDPTGAGKGGRTAA